MWVGNPHTQRPRNISASIAVQQQIKLFDTVNTSITATFSIGHAWTDTTTDIHTETDSIKPEWVGWLSAIPSTETVTGTVTMQGNSPVPINFANVTFSEPGRNASGNPALNFSDVAHEFPMTANQITNICGDGPSNHVRHVVAVNAVPQQASSINATPGSTGQATDQPATPPTTASSSRPRTGQPPPHTNTQRIPDNCPDGDTVRALPRLQLPTPAPSAGPPAASVELVPSSPPS